QAEDGIRDYHVTGVQTCALPILTSGPPSTIPLPSPKSQSNLSMLESFPVAVKVSSVLTHPSLAVKPGDCNGSPRLWIKLGSPNVLLVPANNSTAFSLNCDGTGTGVTTSDGVMDPRCVLPCNATYICPSGPRCIAPGCTVVASGGSSGLLVYVPSAESYANS